MADAPAEQNGTWCFDADPSKSITPLAAIRSMYGQQFHIIAEPGLKFSRDSSDAGIRKAVEVATEADVILAFVGEEAILSGEAHSRADIDLPGAQNKLV